MTVIAAIYPPAGPPIFLSDTLTSVPGERTGRAAGPNGLLARPRNTSGWQIHNLEQKNAILNGKVYVAYCGSSFVAKSVVRRAARALEAISDPTVEQVSAIFSAELDDLERHNTSILAAVLSEGKCNHLAFGSGFQTRALTDGTIVHANGSGANKVLDLFEEILRGREALRPHTYFNPIVWLNYLLTRLRGNRHHIDMSRAFGIVATQCCYESLTAQIDQHFGGIIEIARALPTGFEKFPSATIAIELLSFHDGEADLYGGNYLNYHYVDDLLVYRRFGEINREELTKVFETDYWVASIHPLLRKVPATEDQKACEAIAARPLFSDADVECTSWADLDDLGGAGRVTVAAPDRSRFRIERVDDKFFQIYRSPEYMKSLARRLGVSRVNVKG